METIVFKVPNGTKARLKQINKNVSELMREQAERLTSGKSRGSSAFDKVAHLYGSLPMPAGAATSKDYLKQYAKKSAD